MKLSPIFGIAGCSLVLAAGREVGAAAFSKPLGRAAPELVVWIVADPGAPSRGAFDPDILVWCEEHRFVLVTNNRKSIPRHLADHLALDRHVPGILVINPTPTSISTGYSYRSS